MLTLAVILKTMKQGGGRQAVAGFTIVETMIVMAVTGVMFISAVVLISGRTGKTQFSTAANDLKQQLEQVVNETASGYFPNANNFSCTSGSNGTMPQLAQSTQNQGTNGGCVFLGKAVRFGIQGVSDKYSIFAIAGNRLNGSQEVTNLTDAHPVAVAPGVINFGGITGITLQNVLESGLTIGSVKYNASNTPATGFAVLSTLASYNSAATGACNGVCAGAQGLKLYAITGPALGTATEKQVADYLDNGASSFVDPTNSVAICFNSGTTSNQSVVYTLGDVGNAGSVAMQIQTGACS